MKTNAASLLSKLASAATETMATLTKPSLAADNITGKFCNLFHSQRKYFYYFKLFPASITNFLIINSLHLLLFIICYLNSPIITADTFHALKLVPSGFPMGINTLII